MHVLQEMVLLRCVVLQVLIINRGCGNNNKYPRGRLKGRTDPIVWTNIKFQECVAYHLEIWKSRAIEMQVNKS